MSWTKYTNSLVAEKSICHVIFPVKELTNSEKKQNEEP